MTIQGKALRVLFCAALFPAIGMVGLGADAGDAGQKYTALDKGYYLSAEDAIFLSPGLNLEILDVTIPADRKPVVTFKITDDRGQGLDRLGNVTPGSVSISFLLAYIPQNGSQHINYRTRTQTSPITNATESQATTDSGGTYTVLGDGNYRYTFGTVLPAGYDTGATHTLGIYAARDLREFGLSRYVVNQVRNFIPAGGQVVKIREVVRTAACNDCHNPLRAHGETGRESVEICILCHTPQTKDPDTGNTVDMKVMIHKIHRGAQLPSVQSGTPYTIIGYGQSLHDYSHVEFPHDIRNCSTCHKNAAQVNNWLLNPTRDTCGSCHDDINWVTGANHVAGAQADDGRCAVCHQPQGEFEYDASIAGAHIPPYKSQQLVKPKLEILKISNTAPGQKPTVEFRITDKNNKPVAPAALTGNAGRLALTLAGPSADYRWYVQELADTATVTNGIAAYTFNAAIPADAKGTYAIEAEGWVNALLNPGEKKELAYRDAWDSQVQFFAVTGTVAPRRAVVDFAKCNKCHDKLQLHGNNRNQLAACVVCHNPANTDIARRPGAAGAAESVDMKILIHKIHTGEELNGDYTVYGFGSIEHNFKEVRYPGDRRDCLQCHLPGTFTVPLPSAVTASTTPRNYWSPTQPTAAACLGCHDSLEAAAHAFLNTATFGESCAVCHAESAEYGVSKLHAR